MFKLLIAALLATSFYATTVYAQEEAQEQAVEQSEEQTSQDVERVEVQGERPKLYYMAEYRRFQKDFFGKFNDLVDDTEMQVVCTNETTTGSRMKRRNCQPRFINTIIAEETQKELSMGTSILDAGNLEERPKVQKAIIKEYKKFQKLTAKLLNENPELAKTYMEMQDALAKVQSFEK